MRGDAGDAGIAQRYLGQVVQALQRAERPVLVWLEFQDCAGNTESMLRSSDPPVADVVLELLSWEYHETIMAGAGKQAEAVLRRVVQQDAGKYIAIVEGAIPTADGGVYCTIGGRTALDIATEVCTHAAASIAVGACAWDGGLVRSNPNPTGAVGLQEAVPGIKVVNLGGCPHNVANTAAVLVHYLTFHEMPALNQYNRPLFAYGEIIHDQCERRAHYAGQFVEEWGDEGSRKGWCLYKMGCKGPDATYNCPTVRWNGGTSWPVKSGHGCIACASNRFWDTMTPFYKPLPMVPGFGADVTAEKVGWGLVGTVAALSVAHGVGSIIRAKRSEDSESAQKVETEPPSPTNVGGVNGAHRSGPSHSYRRTSTNRSPIGLIMFAIWAFVIHHVYSAVLIGIEERSGLVGGIFSGYKFFPESRVKQDAAREVR